jgi:hypothetical protein
MSDFTSPTPAPVSIQPKELPGTANPVTPTLAEIVAALASKVDALTEEVAALKRKIHGAA